MSLCFLQENWDLSLLLQWDGVLCIHEEPKEVDKANALWFALYKCLCSWGRCLWRPANMEDSKREFLLWILLFLAYVWKCCSFHLSRAWCERLCSSSREKVTSPLTQTDMGAVQVLLGQGFQNEKESSSGKAAWVAMQLPCLESSCLLCGELPSSSPSLFANEVKESVLPSVTDLKTANYWKITALTVRAKSLTR